MREGRPQSLPVLALFDSVFRGYPIGSLLLWEHRAAAARIGPGQLKIDAPETEHAWSAVDGQQRLTALSASLTPDSGGSRDEPFDIYFDAALLASGQIGLRYNGSHET